MEKENIHFAVENKIREGKGGRYLEKENIFFAEIKKNEKGKNIWKYIFCGGEERQRRKRRKVFLEG